MNAVGEGDWENNEVGMMEGNGGGEGGRGGRRYEEVMQGWRELVWTFNSTDFRKFWIRIYLGI